MRVRSLLLLMIGLTAVAVAVRLANRDEGEPRSRKSRGASADRLGESQREPASNADVPVLLGRWAREWEAPRQIRGTAFNSDGKPASNCAIICESLIDRSQAAEVRTDNVGAFVLTGLAAGVRFRLVAVTDSEHPGIGTADAYAGDDDVRISLRRSTSIFGRVVLPDGRPAPGARVRVRTPPLPRRKMSTDVADAEGNWTLTSVPEVPVCLTAEQLESTFQWRGAEYTVEASGSVDVAEDQFRNPRERIEIQLRRKCSVVRAQFLDAKGRKIAGAGWWISEGSTLAGSRSLVTDERGRIHVLMEEYPGTPVVGILQVSGEQSTPVLLETTPVSSEVSELVEIEAIDLRMVISGIPRGTDAEGSIDVYAYPIDTSGSQHRFLRWSGRLSSSFSLSGRIPRGVTEVHAVVKTHDRRIGFIEMWNPRHAAHVDLRPVERFRRIRGRCLTPDGEPAAGASVGEGFSGKCDDRGRFDVQIPRSLEELEICMPLTGWLSVPIGSNHRNAGPAELGDLRLNRPRYGAGIVRTVHGAGIGGARIATTYSSTSTDRMGRFAIPLHAEARDVRVSSPGYGLQIVRLDTRRSVSVVLREEAIVCVKLGASWRPANFEVADANGRVVSQELRWIERAGCYGFDELPSAELVVQRLSPWRSVLGSHNVVTAPGVVTWVLAD